MAQGVGRGLETRRIDVARINDVQAKVTSIVGKVVVGPDPGEATINVPFPIWYVEEPNVSFGAELYPNSPLVPGRFPTCDAMVLNWELKEPDGVGAGRKYWIGATLLVVTTGVTGQRIYVHYRMEGVALRNPANRTDDLTTDDAV